LHFLDNRSGVLFIRTLQQREVRLFVNVEKVIEPVIPGRAPDGHHLETERWRISSRNGCGGFICGGSFAAYEQPLFA
jgi:hypothetical protein